MKTTTAFILTLSAFFAGCSFNYKDAQIPEEIEESVPNIVMTDVVHSQATKKHLLMRVTAERSESYEKKKMTVLSGVKFLEYDSLGTLVAEGRADKITYFNDTKNAEVAGNIVVHSHKEKGGIETDYLYWDDKNRTLKGKPDSKVRLIDDDGSNVQGTGFEADLKRMVISFIHAVEGAYVVSDTE